jgi:adenosylcobinamide kinase/adenosylcobinamide-phosphate guanylyltransferase
LNQSIFILGGCRSGKSRYALELAGKFTENHKIFIATCVPADEEMKQRVARHQKDRGESWKTLEVPIRLPEAIRENSLEGNMILVDCITLWISNLLMAMQISSVDEIIDPINRLTYSLNTAQCPVILVSNEVGTGIVPENQLARLFRDITGMVNQKLAACTDKVVWMVAGIPVTVKPKSKTP